MNFQRIILVVVLILFGVNHAQAQTITKKRGKYKFYHPNGKVSAVGKVKNYHLNGVWKSFNENGNLIIVYTYKMDSLNGSYKEFHENGKPFLSGAYCMNKKCGNWKIYDDSGAQVGDENFANGVANGVQRHWYPNGVHRDSSIVNSGVTAYAISWYSTGKTRTIETYKDGHPHGRWVYYPETSVDTFPDLVDEYKDGLKHGWHYAWSGRTLIQSFHYSNGELDGLSSRFDKETGKVSVEENYSNGQLQGTCRYYRNGLIIRADEYEQGVRHGAQTEYGRDGYVIKRKWYTKGTLDSMYTYYENGKVAVMQRYIPKTTNSTWTEYNEHGSLLIYGALKNDRRNGLWCVYYSNGNLHSCTPYKDGVIQGTYTRWYDSGKKMLEYEISNTGQVTKSTIWNENGKILNPASKEYKEIYESNLPGNVFTDIREFNRGVIDRDIEDNRIK